MCSLLQKWIQSLKNQPLFLKEICANISNVNILICKHISLLCKVQHTAHFLCQRCQLFLITKSFIYVDLSVLTDTSLCLHRQLPLTTTNILVFNIDAKFNSTKLFLLKSKLTAGISNKKNWCIPVLDLSKKLCKHLKKSIDCCHSDQETH